MGINIDLHVFDYEAFMDRLSEVGASDRGRINAILDECGHRLADKYVLLNDEYHEDSNPYYTLFSLLDAAFGLDDLRKNSHGAAMDTPGWNKGISGIDRDDVAARLGITLPDDE